MVDDKHPLIGFAARARMHMFLFALSAYAAHELYLIAPALSLLVPGLMLAGVLWRYLPGISRHYGLALAVLLFVAALLMKSPSDYTVNVPLALASLILMFVSMFLKASPRRGPIAAET